MFVGALFLKLKKATKISKLFLKLFDTSGANALAVKINDIVNVVAEYASGLILLKDYLIVIGENFDSVLGLYIQNVTDLDGKNDSSEFIDLTNNSSRFHGKFLLKNKKRLLRAYQS